MNEERLTRAIEEANRFLAAAKSYQERLQADSYLSFTGCRESGAVRRSSMDLTRALAQLRKPC